MSFMPRGPREESEGAIWHVFARGNRQQETFVDDDDRALYLKLLGRTVTWQRWLCLAYCLMDNHVHLLLETPQANLGSGVQRLHGRYAQAFNKRHGRSGHLFQGRYGSVRVESDEQLWVTARYIAMNPVEAGLCGEPEAWVWSSHAALVGAAAAPAWLDVARLRGYFSTWGSRYEAFVR
jgi:putative transposase